MTSEKPSISPTGKYTVIQAAQRLGVSQNTIRNYFRQGFFRTSEYNKRTFGHRGLYFTGMGLMRLWNSTMV